MVSPLAACITPLVELSAAGVYRQDFDGLTAIKKSWHQAAGSGLLPEGWYLHKGGLGFGGYRADDGRRMGNGYYSYGTRSDGDRALGTLQQSWGWGRRLTFGAGFRNASEEAFEGISIEFTGEQWRLGAAAAQDRLDFQYSLDAETLTGGSWIDFDLLDFIGPSSGGFGAKDGNAPENRRFLAASLAVSLDPDDTLWIRWVDRGGSLRGSGLAVDDFLLRPLWEGNVTPVPEGGTIWAGGGVLGMALVGLLRRRKVRRAASPGGTAREEEEQSAGKLGIS